MPLGKARIIIHEVTDEQKSCDVYGHVPEPVEEGGRIVAMRCSKCHVRCVSEGTKLDTTGMSRL